MIFMDQKFFIAPGTIALISMIIFIIPGSLLLFSFSGVAFMSGEIWRLFTFPFAHTSMAHLLENIGALVATSLLSYLIGIRGRQFLTAFIGSSILLALTDSVLFPTLVIAGSSLGIYAVLGAISTKGSNFIPQQILFPLLLSSVFFKYVIEVITTGGFLTGTVFSQTVLHFFGFMSGIVIFYILGMYKTKKRVLTLDG